MFAALLARSVPFPLFYVFFSLLYKFITGGTPSVLSRGVKALVWFIFAVLFSALWTNYVSVWVCWLCVRYIAGFTVDDRCFLTRQKLIIKKQPNTTRS